MHSRQWIEFDFVAGITYARARLSKELRRLLKHFSIRLRNAVVETDIRLLGIQKFYLRRIAAKHLCIIHAIFNHVCTSRQRQRFQRHGRSCRFFHYAFFRNGFHHFTFLLFRGKDLRPLYKRIPVLIQVSKLQIPRRKPHRFVNKVIALMRETVVGVETAPVLIFQRCAVALSVELVIIQTNPYVYVLSDSEVTRQFIIAQQVVGIEGRNIVILLPRQHRRLNFVRFVRRLFQAVGCGFCIGIEPIAAIMGIRRQVNIATRRQGRHHPKGRRQS